MRKCRKGSRKVCGGIAGFNGRAHGSCNFLRYCTVRSADGCSFFRQCTVAVLFRPFFPVSFGNARFFGAPRGTFLKQREIELIKPQVGKTSPLRRPLNPGTEPYTTERNWEIGGQNDPNRALPKEIAAGGTRTVHCRKKLQPETDPARGGPSRGRPELEADPRQARAA